MISPCRSTNTAQFQNLTLTAAHNQLQGISSIYAFYFGFTKFKLIMKKLRKVFERKPKPPSNTLTSPPNNETASGQISRPASIQSAVQTQSPQIITDSSSVNHLPAASPLLESSSAGEQATVSIEQPPTGVGEDEGDQDQQSLTTRETLWRRAYSILAEKQPDLVKDYAKHLHGDRDDANEANLSVLADPELIKTCIADLLAAREKCQWSIKLGGKSVKVKDQVETLAKLLVWSDKIIKDALSAQPYAALAWSGVSVFLPLISAGSKQSNEMIEGFSAITDIQLYWMNCEDLYLTPSQVDNYTALIEPLAAVYADILEFQALAICHLSKNQLNRAWEKVTGVQDWADKKKSISLKSAACKAFISNGQQQELRDQSKQQRDILQGISNATKEISDVLKDQCQQKKESELLDSLASMAPNRVECKRMNPSRAEGTCEWFFTDPTFQNWRDENDAGLFWLSAGPGCGKSVLSTALIDEGHLETTVATLDIESDDLPTTLVSSTLCYFYFKDGDDRRVTGTNALSSVLHQIFTDANTKSLIHHGTEYRNDHGDGMKNSLSQLWDLLVLCSKASSGPIICLLDALDECKEESRQQLISLLDQFYGSGNKESRGKLKFFITSRPYGDLEDSFECFNEYAAYFRFDADEHSDHISHDINLVIEQKVQQLGKRRKFTADALRKITQHFKSMGTRTYLWLYLTMSIIEKNVSRYSRASAVEAVLSEIQPNLCQVYEKILSATKSPDITEPLLAILLAATRPLTLDEANHALTLALEKKCPANLNELHSKIWPANFAQVVKDLCGLLVQVHDSTISFIHLTAREFLLGKNQNADSSADECWRGRFNNKSLLHTTIAKVCIDQLHFPDIPIYLDEKWSDSSCPFLLYAALNWPHHYYFCQLDTIRPLYEEKVIRLLDPASPVIKIWSRWYFDLNGKYSFPMPLALCYFRRYGRLPENWNGWSSVDIASYFNLHAVIQTIFGSRKVDIDQSNEIFGTALQNASAMGHDETVQTLLNNGAAQYLNTQPDGALGDIFPSAELKYSSALHAACEMNRVSVAQLLLSYRTDVDIVTLQGTALQVACSLGYESIVDILLSFGADANCDNHVQSCLQLSCARGYGRIVDKLLDKGADPNSRILYKTHSSSPLYEACARGHRAIATRLLLAGAHLDCIIPYLEDICNHQSAVELLSSNETDISNDKYGIAPQMKYDIVYNYGAKHTTLYPRLFQDQSIFTYQEYSHFLRNKERFQNHLTGVEIMGLVWQICREQLPNSITTTQMGIISAKFDEGRLFKYLVSKFGDTLELTKSSLHLAISTGSISLVRTLLELCPSTMTYIDKATLEFSLEVTTGDMVEFIMSSFNAIDFDHCSLLMPTMSNKTDRQNILTNLVSNYPFDDNSVLDALENLVSQFDSTTVQKNLEAEDIDACLRILLRALSQNAAISCSIIQKALLFATSKTIQFMLQYCSPRTDIDRLLCSAIRHFKWSSQMTQLLINHFSPTITQAVVREVILFGNPSTTRSILKRVLHNHYISSELLLLLLSSPFEVAQLKAILTFHNPISEDVII